MITNEWAQSIINTGLIITAIITMVTATVFLYRWSRRINAFLGDWFGEAARPGFSREPGVMERLQMLENHTRELEYNHGTSVKDMVQSLVAKVNCLDDKVSRLSQGDPNEP